MEQQVWGAVLFLVFLTFIVGFIAYLLLTAINDDVRRTTAMSSDALRGVGGFDILARYGSLDANDDLLVLRRGRRSGPPIQVRRVHCGWSMLWLTLHDGRVIGAPLARYPQLAVANWWQRRRWELRDGGSTVIWPDLEFQVSARLLLGHEDS